MMKNRRLIIVVSILIPLVVALLFGVKIEGYDLSFLPPIYAGINGLTALMLLLALWFIKQGRTKNHERTIMVCIGLSIVFLVLYVLYHITSDPTPFGGEGIIKYVYYITLISHILLSVLVIPLVLFSVYYAKNANFVAHRKMVKWSFPIWFYVAVSGVIVYLLIRPYYA